MISLTTNSLTTLLNGTDASNAALLSVVNGAVRYTDSSNPDFLLNNLNASILGEGSLTGVQLAIDTYTESLPSSNVYESAYTTPSSAFLGDLKALESDASSGNLGAARSDLAQAKLDNPGTGGDGISRALAKGDTAGEADIEIEAASGVADYLVSLGYTSADAHTEADAIEISGLVGQTNSTPQAAQTRLNQIADLATSVAKSTPLIAQGTLPAPSSPLFNVTESLLEAPSAAASNEDLARLDSFYGTGGSSANPASGGRVDSYA